MQFTYATLATLMATVAYSQSISDELAKLPSCADACLKTAAGVANCGETDYACQCGPGKDTITKSAVPCIASTCQPSDIATVQGVTDEICKIQAASGDSGSSASSAASSAASSVVSSKTSEASSAAASTSSAASSLSSALSSASSEVSSAASTASAAASSAAGSASSTPSPTPNAGSKMGPAGAVLGAAVMAAFAL